MRSVQRLFAHGFQQHHLMIDSTAVEVQLDLEPDVLCRRSFRVTERLELYDVTPRAIVLNQKDHDASPLSTDFPET